MAKYIISVVMIFLTQAVFAQQTVLPLAEKAVSINSKTLLTDPTKPLDYKAKQPRKKIYRQHLPVLQSIVIESEKRLAIMNNKSYEVGQKVNGYKITRIEQASVYLTYSSKIYNIRLYSNTERFIQ